MKYLTLDWWRSECPREALERNWRYIDSVKDRLPADTLLLFDNVGLHDGMLRRLDLDVARKCLAIRLEGYNFSAEPVEGGRIIVLTYSGVRNLGTTADPEQGLQVLTVMATWDTTRSNYCRTARWNTASSFPAASS